MTRSPNGVDEPAQAKLREAPVGSALGKRVRAGRARAGAAPAGRARCRLAAPSGLKNIVVERRACPSRSPSIHTPAPLTVSSCALLVGGSPMPATVNGALLAFCQRNLQRSAGRFAGPGATGCHTAPVPPSSRRNSATESDRCLELREQPRVCRRARGDRQHAEASRVAARDGDFDRLGGPGSAWLRSSAARSSSSFEDSVATGTTSAPADPPPSSSVATIGARRGLETGVLPFPAAVRSRFR